MRRSRKSTEDTDRKVIERVAAPALNLDAAEIAALEAHYVAHTIVGNE